MDAEALALRCFLIGSSVAAFMPEGNPHKDTGARRGQFIVWGASVRNFLQMGHAPELLIRGEWKHEASNQKSVSSWQSAGKHRPRGSRCGIGTNHGPYSFALFCGNFSPPLAVGEA